MDIVLGVVAVVMLALVGFLFFAMARARRQAPSAAGTPGATGGPPTSPAQPSPLAAWASGRGVYVAEPAPPTITLAADLKPARMEPKRTLRVIGDVQRDGFTAQTWEVEVSHRGGMGMTDVWQALTVPASGPLPDLAVVATREIVHAELCMPQRFAAGPVEKEGGVAFFGAPPEARQRLAPLAGRIAATGAWVVTGASGVSLTQQVEPDPAQLEERIALAREVAAALGG